MIYTLDNKIIVSFYYTCESKGEKHAALVYILTYMTWIVVMEMYTMTTSTADRENKQTEIIVREMNVRPVSPLFPSPHLTSVTSMNTIALLTEPKCTETLN